MVGSSAQLGLLNCYLDKPAGRNTTWSWQWGHPQITTSDLGTASKIQRHQQREIQIHSVDSPPPSYRKRVRDSFFNSNKPFFLTHPSTLIWTSYYNWSLLRTQAGGLGRFFCSCAVCRASWSSVCMHESGRKPHWQGASCLNLEISSRFLGHFTL